MQAVLAGSFFRAPDRLRVTAQLVATATGEILWSDKVDVPAQDLITVQDKLAERVVAGLRLTLTPEEQAKIEQRPTRSAPAYEFYLRGRDLLLRYVLRTLDLEDLERALGMFHEAIGLDPDFAAAHAALARCYVLHAQGYGGDEHYQLAERSLRRALELDPVFADGFYDRPPVRGLKAFAAIYAGWGFSEPFYRTAAYGQFNARNHEEFVEYFWEPFFVRCDANNLLSQLWTWQHSDISDNPAYGGDFERALGAIKARTIIVPSELDRYFPPVDSENEARHIPGASWRHIPSIWGHMALFNAADGAFIDQALKELLG